MTSTSPEMSTFNNRESSKSRVW